MTCDNGGYVVQVDGDYPTGTKQFRLVVWDFHGLRNDEGLKTLKGIAARGEVFEGAAGRLRVRDQLAGVVLGDLGAGDHLLESLETVVKHALATQPPGKTTRFFGRLSDSLREEGLESPRMVSSPYVNTIPVDKQAPFPGDWEMERRIKSIIRWNAMAMVVRANKHTNVGGHIASFASSATLYDVGFNHFWRAPSESHPGDLIFHQGHSSPGIYARSFLEGRIAEDQMDLFRMEVAGRELEAVVQELTEAHVLDLHDVTAKDQLQSRRLVVQRFAAVNQKLANVISNSETLFRADLKRLGVSPAATEQAMSGFHNAAIQRNSLLLQIRGADARMAKSMSGILDLLEENWGAWKHDDATGKILFTRTGLVGPYNQFLDEVQTAGQNEINAQRRLINLRN